MDEGFLAVKASTASIGPLLTFCWRCSLVQCCFDVPSCPHRARPVSEGSPGSGAWIKAPLDHTPEWERTVVVRYYGMVGTGIIMQPLYTT